MEDVPQSPHALSSGLIVLDDWDDDLVDEGYFSSCSDAMSCHNHSHRDRDGDRDGDGDGSSNPPSPGPLSSCAGSTSCESLAAAAVVSPDRRSKGRGRGRPRGAVRFGPPEVRHTLGRWELSPAELIACWFGQADIDRIEGEARETLRDVRRGGGGGLTFPEDGPSPCLRGIEQLQTRRSLLDHQRSQKLAVHAVLAAQDQGVDDPAELLDISRRFTAPARTYAAQMGLADAVAARSDLSDLSDAELQTFLPRVVEAPIHQGALDAHEDESSRVRERTTHVRKMNAYMAMSLEDMLEQKDPNAIRRTTNLFFSSVHGGQG